MVGIPPIEVKNQDDLNMLFFRAMQEAVGADGTILVPAYSYTFGKSKASELAIFDPKETPAEIGPFPNFFLRQDGVVRSLDPMMSVAALGPRAAEFLEGNLSTSYGEGSFFSKLAKSDAKCCSIGLGPNWTPFIHYADWLYRVPFRFDKLFYGLVRDGGKLKKMAWLYSVRIMADESYPDAHKAGRAAEEVGIWRFAPLGRARVYTASIKEYFDFVCEKLEKDKWFLARGPAGDVVEIERQRVNSGYAYRDFGEFDKAAWLSAMQNIRIDTVSDGFDNIIFEIQKRFGGKIKARRSGEWVGDFIVPEKWTLKSASLVDTVSGKELLNGGDLKVKPYSLSFSGEVSKETLFAHTNAKYDAPHFANRDWGFEGELPLCGEKFAVEIKSDFSFGELKYLDVGNGNDIVVCYVKQENLHNTVNLLADVKDRRMIFVSGYVGFLSWLDDNKGFSGKIEHIGIEGEHLTGGNPLVANL
jgi:aminoglycoside N3'-acetyltransferase